jgi:DNA repair protein RecN (Recombination protein N)
VLVNLELFDFAIADGITVALGPGLNVLSGETGAGKSLLIDALALLAGARADAGVIRFGTDAALVQATFEDADGERIFARRIVRSGRNAARIDGEVVTVAELQAALSPRLGIFGQQGFRTLLDPAEQRAWLDAHLAPEAAAAAEAYARAWAERRTLQERIERWRNAARDRERNLDLLRYQREEIDAARLSIGEDARIDERIAALRHRERIRAGVTEALGALTESEWGAVDRLVDARRALLSVARHQSALATLADEVDAALSSVQAIANELERWGEEGGGDEELDELEARRAEIATLTRKYGAGVEGVLATRARLEAEWSALARHEEDGEAYLAREQALSKELHAWAQIWRRGREAVAARLTPAANDVLARLALPHAQLEVAWTPGALGPFGSETATLRFSANRGEPAAPLTDVASGGELSRVMLALHAALGSDRPTLAFDEVDAGLGGRAGRAVGEVLSALARDRQVLVVTHLPQVAAFADRHLRVEKRSDGERTTTTVVELSDDERVLELARMLAGEASEAACGHARALLASVAMLRRREPQSRASDAVNASTSASSL